MGLRIDMEIEKQETEKRLNRIKKNNPWYMSEEEIADEYGFPGK